MSPIYVRPAREQSEHDRLIRHLQSKYKKKFEVAVNIDGVEPVTFVKIGPATLSPDLVLTEGKKLAGLVEVETGESVNNLEAMAQWVHFAHARVPFHLYVPVHGYEPARRLCDSYHARVGEIWTYRPTHDGFDLVRMHNDPTAAAGVRGVKALPVSIFVPAPPKPVVPEVVDPPRPVAPAAKPVVPPKPVAGAKPVAAAKPVPVAKPVAPAKPPAKAAQASDPKASAKPAATLATKGAKPAPKPVKPTKAAKANGKGSKAARPAKTTNSKAKSSAKPVAKVKKPAPARGKKPASRKSR